MAGLIGRVKMLERAAGLHGECAACGGRGAPGFEVWIDGERTRPESGGCANCGRRGVVTRVMIDGPEDGGGAGAPTPAAHARRAAP